MMVELKRITSVGERCQWYIDCQKIENGPTLLYILQAAELFWHFRTHMLQAKIVPQNRNYFKGCRSNASVNHGCG